MTDITLPSAEEPEFFRLLDELSPDELESWVETVPLPEDKPEFYGLPTDPSEDDDLGWMIREMGREELKGYAAAHARQRREAN